MAVTLALTDGYATLDEADTYLELNTTWSAASDEAKEDALMWARYYIEQYFDYNLDAIDTIDDEAKLANSVLAADYVTSGQLFGNSEPAIKRQKVKADVVEKEVEYQVGQRFVPESQGKAFALMARIATRLTGNTVALIRS